MYRYTRMIKALDQVLDTTYARIFAILAGVFNDRFTQAGQTSIDSKYLEEKQSAAPSVSSVAHDLLALCNLTSLSPDASYQAGPDLELQAASEQSIVSLVKCDNASGRRDTAVEGKDA